MRKDLVAEVRSKRVDCVDGHPLGIRILRLLDLLDKDRQEFVIVEAKFILDVEDY